MTPEKKQQREKLLTSLADLTQLSAELNKPFARIKENQFTADLNAGEHTAKEYAKELQNEKRDNFTNAQ